IGALTLLAWNPYDLLDAGFQLSFAAVAAIFVLVPRFQRRLEGYPVPRTLADVLAVSAACGLATAPVLWLQFHAVPLLSVPANALAAPAVAPLLGLSFATALAHALFPPAAAPLAWLNGWCAAYLAGCARPDRTWAPGRPPISRDPAAASWHTWRSAPSLPPMLGGGGRARRGL